MFKDNMRRTYAPVNDGESIVMICGLMPGSAVAIRYDQAKYIVIKLGGTNNIEYVSQGKHRCITDFWAMMLDKWDNNLFNDVIHPRKFTCDIIFTGVAVVKNIPIRDGDNVIIKNKNVVMCNEPYTFIIYYDNNQIGYFVAAPFTESNDFTKGHFPVDEDLVSSWNSQLVLMQLAYYRKNNYRYVRPGN